MAVINSSLKVITLHVFCHMFHFSELARTNILNKVVHGTEALIKNHSTLKVILIIICYFYEHLTIGDPEYVER